MKLRIVIDVFSGRENPVIDLTEEESADISGRLKPAGEKQEKGVALPLEPILGYRGLIVEQVGEIDKTFPKILRYAHGDVFADGQVFRAADEALEDFVCGSTGLINRMDPGPGFPDFTEEIERLRELRYLLDPRIVELQRRRHLRWWPCLWWWPCYWWCWRRCRCAPVYEPEWWNDGGQIQYNNNCYNYSTNYRTDTFAQPGRASGNMYTDLSGCSVPTGETSTQDGAVSDGLIDAPDANNVCPTEGHLVTLVSWPGWDFHWYRKGKNKRWSHKPGGTQATNLDNSGNAISDPRTAERGGYTEFCTFMVVKHGHIKIR